MPTKILIAGVEYTITYKPNMSGGTTDLVKKFIHIGTRGKKDILNIFIHELGEAILYERGLRYDRYSGNDTNDGVRFILTHHEYENLIGDIITIVSQLKGLKFEE